MKFQAKPVSPTRFGLYLITFSALLFLIYRALTHFGLVNGIYAGVYGFIASYIIIFPVIFGISMVLIFYKFLKVHIVIMLLFFLFFIIIGFVMLPAIVG